MTTESERNAAADALFQQRLDGVAADMEDVLDRLPRS
jgi:hypothetical protein